MVGRRVRSGLRSLAWAAISTAALMLTLGWALPASLHPEFAAQRPFAFMLLGGAALLMAWLARQRAASMRWRYRRSAPVVQTFAPTRSAKAAAASTQVSAEPLSAVPAEAPPSTQGETLQAARTEPIRWHAGVFALIEWQRFQALCEAVLQQDGHSTHLQPLGVEAGIDIWLHSASDPERAASVARCDNHWRVPIGVPALRDFLGAMTDAGVDSGLFIAAGEFGAEAQAFARRNRITPIDGRALLALIGQRPEAAQLDLLAVATAGEYWRPTCARCGHKMVDREGGHGRPGHWSCSTTLECAHSLVWAGA